MCSTVSPPLNAWHVHGGTFMAFMRWLRCAKSERAGERVDPVAGFEFVRANQADHAVATMCRVLGVSTSG